MIVLLVAAVSGGALNEPKFKPNDIRVTTIQSGFKELANVTVDDTPLTATTKTWAVCVATFTPVPAEWSYLRFQFYAYGDGSGDGDPEGATFTATISACNWFGGARQAAILTGTVGAMTLSNNPVGGEVLTGTYKWVDTLVVTAGSEKFTDGFLNAGQGTDDISEYLLDGGGACGVRVVITNMTGQPVTNFSYNSYLISVSNGAVLAMNAAAYGVAQSTNSAVTLYALPSKGFTFNGWQSSDSSDLDLNSNPLIVTMTKNRTVTPKFRRPLRGL